MIAPCLSVWTAAVGEDTHTRVEHPHLPLLRVLTVANPGTAAHPVDPGDADAPLDLVLSPVSAPRLSQPQYWLDHRAGHAVPLSPPAPPVLQVVHQPAQPVLHLPAGRLQDSQQSHRHHQGIVRPAPAPGCGRHKQLVLRLVPAVSATLRAAHREPALTQHTCRAGRLVFTYKSNSNSNIPAVSDWRTAKQVRQVRGESCVGERPTGWSSTTTTWWQGMSLLATATLPTPSLLSTTQG